MTPESVDPEIVGNAFVQKYYNSLYESPAEAHRFYLEGSVLTRPGLNGEIVSVNSLKDINEQIMAFDYKNSKIQILSADSQPSLNNGVVTQVTGFVIGKDGERTKFSQAFFLVSQNGSYFVLNDLFRYISNESVEPEATEKVEETPVVIESPEIITTEPAKEIVETVVTKPASPITNGHVKVPEEKVVCASPEAKPQEDTPKRSFADIVGSPATKAPATKAPATKAPAPKAPAPKAPATKAPAPTAPTPTAPAPTASAPKAPAPKASEQTSAKTIEKQGQGGSIFVARLPMDATREQLYETFKGFGDIKKHGIQVRSYTDTGNCFGFVSFESSEAVTSVLQAHKESPFIIGNKKVSVERQRGNGGNVNGGRSSGGNSGYYRKENGNRNDGYKPRENGGRGSGRNGSERRNGEATTGDGKANQKNGHGNAQAKN